MQSEAEVRPQYLGVKVGPDQSRPPKIERTIGGACGVAQETEWTLESVFHVPERLEIVEADDEDLNPGGREFIRSAGHLHEMAFTKESADVSQERQDSY